MTPDEQLDLWVAGSSVHNKERDECCPDFSCCKPKLLRRLAERIAYCDASKLVRNRMLVDYLVNMVQSEGHEVV